MASISAMIDAMSRIHHLARRGDPFALQELLDGGADPNDLLPNGTSPLQKAVQAEHESCVRLLVARGADLNHCNSRGRSVLASSTTLSMLRLLLELGANPNGTIGHGHTLANLKAMFGMREHVELLLAFGADPEATNKQGQTVRELIATVKPPVDEFFARAASQESIDRVTQALLKESDDLAISPEEYVAHHREILMWSYYAYELPDAALKGWATRVWDLINNPDELDNCYRTFLTGAELERALRANERTRRRIAIKRMIKEKQTRFMEASGASLPPP